MSSDAIFQCWLCQKMYANLTSLRDHSYGYTNERPFICSECPATFIKKDRLIKHMNNKQHQASVIPVECPMTKAFLNESMKKCRGTPVQEYKRRRVV